MGRRPAHARGQHDSLPPVWDPVARLRGALLLDPGDPDPAL